MLVQVGEVDQWSKTNALHAYQRKPDIEHRNEDGHGHGF